MKTSLGIWAFGSMVTRFVPGGYKPERRARRQPHVYGEAVEGLGDLIDGYEFHYPQELTRTTWTRSVRRWTVTTSTASQGHPPRFALRPRRPRIAGPATRAEALRDA